MMLFRIKDESYRLESESMEMIELICAEVEEKVARVYRIMLVPAARPVLPTVRVAVCAKITGELLVKELAGDTSP